MAMTKGGAPLKRSSRRLHHEVRTNFIERHGKFAVFRLFHHADLDHCRRILMNPFHVATQGTRQSTHPERPGVLQALDQFPALGRENAEQGGRRFEIEMLALVFPALPGRQESGAED